MLLSGAPMLPLTVLAQTGGVGIGTPNPASRLEVNGGLTLTETASPALTGTNPSYTIPTNVSQVRLVPSGTAPTGTIALTSTTPVSGQYLTVYNGTTIPATLNSQTVPAGNAVTFVYSNGGWRTTSASGPAGPAGATGTAGSNATVAAGPGLSSTVSGTTTTVQLGGSALMAATDVPLAGNALTFSSATGGKVGVGNGTTVPYTLSVKHDNGTPVVSAGNGLSVSHVLGPTWVMYVSNTAQSLQFYRDGVKEVEFTPDGSVNNVSDSTAKTQVRQLENGQMARLMQLQPKSYRYKAQFSNQRQYGLMAQELVAVYPDMVQHNRDDDGRDSWTVSYTKLIPVLVKALQEQELARQQQAARLDSLEAQVKLLQQLSRSVPRK